MALEFDNTVSPPAKMVLPVLEESLLNPYLTRQAARESNARSYPRRLPVALRRAEGILVEDTDGRTYFDCLSGAGALALGHRHPVVLEAVRTFLEEGLPWQTLDLTTPVKDRFIETLFQSLPSDFSRRARIQFCGPSGADAVEAAIKLVKTATGRRAIFSFQGGYHGMTNGALALTGHLSPKEPVTGLMADVHFLPYPYLYRCPFGIGGDEGHRLAGAYLEHLLDDPNSGITAPAGIILEVVQGEGGVIPAPDPWLRDIRRITLERNIPLIVDEVQTGLGRTGRTYAFEQADIRPDVVILSKAIGGGLPLSVVVYDAALDRWAPGAHAGTFRGNQMAMAAGEATIRFAVERRLHEQARQQGERLMARLRTIQEGSASIGEVRGRGLMVGAEIVDKEAAPDRLGSHPADPARAGRIQAESLRRGLILELGGRYGSVVRFLPPLIITAEQVDQIAAIFQEAVSAAEREAI